MKFPKLFPIFVFVFIASGFLFQSAFAQVEELDNYSEVNAVCTTWTSPTQSVVALNITDGVDFDFLLGEKYLLIATGDIGGSSSAEQVGVKMLHGITDFEGSKFVFEVDEENDNACNTKRELYTWFWWTVYNPLTVGEANEDIIIEYEILSPFSQSGYHDNVSFVAIHLNSTLIIENTDWFFDENTVDTTLTQTFGGSGNATLSFTPSINNQNWMILGSTQMDTGDATINYASRMFVEGGSCTFCDKPEITIEGENPTFEQFVQTFARVIPLGATPQVIHTQSRLDGGAGSGTQERLYSSIFALNLDLFDAQTSNYIDPTLLLSDVLFGTEVITATIEPPTTSDVIVIADIGTEGNDSDNSSVLRVQVNDADTLPDQTTNESGYEGEYSVDDIWRWSMMSVENLAGNTTQKIDVDGSQFKSGLNSNVIQRSVIAFTLKLGGLDLVEQPDDVMSMIDDIRLDRPFNQDNPISMTDDIQLTLGKNDVMSMIDDIRLDRPLRIDNPYSMIDSVNATQFSQPPFVVNDPYSITDSIVTTTNVLEQFDDQYSMTDDIRLDRPFNVDNLISMTDDIQLTLGKNDVMSMIDDIQLTLGKNDVMSMIDDIRLDIEFNVNDPYSITDSIVTTTNVLEQFDDQYSMTDDIRLDVEFNVDEPLSMIDSIVTIQGTLVQFDDQYSMTDDIILTFNDAVQINNPISMKDSLDFFRTFGQVVVIVVPPTGGGGGGGGLPVQNPDDIDGDGILDDVDDCPLQPETFNNFQDLDGCPDIFDRPEPLTIADLGFPFEFNELSIVDDFINLETDSPQPQAEDLGIRWLGDEPITINSITVGDSPFEIQFEDIPLEFGNNQFGYTQEQIFYTVQEPAKVCGTVFNFDCVDEETYKVPVFVKGEVRGKTVVAEGSITIDNSNRFNPYWFVIFFLLFIPIVAYLYWRMSKTKAKPDTKTLLKLTQAKPTGRLLVTRSPSLKRGTTRKILTESEKTNILGRKTK